VMTLTMTLSRGLRMKSEKKEPSSTDD